MTDVVCPMYPPVEVVERWAEWAESTELDDRPMILCEYSHAMGNSNGGVDRYGEAFHRLPALAGGFIWDWKDQGLAESDDDGHFYWAYGGHFGDQPNDANFCINGLVGPDGLPHPGLIEVAWAYRPVAVEHVRGRRVRVRNRRAFEALDDLRADWSLLVDGSVVEAGQLVVEVEAGASRTIDVPYETQLPRDAEVHLTMCWRTVAATPWADAGHLVAHDEVVLRSSTSGSRVAVAPVRDGGEPALIEAHGWTVRWSDAGMIDLEAANGAVLRELGPTLWRAPTDNDGVGQGWMADVQGKRPAWVAAGLDRLSTQLDAAVGTDDRVTLSGRLCSPLGDQATWSTTVAAHEQGLDLTHVIEPVEGSSIDDLPRVGLRAVADRSYDTIRWFGLGPHETYPDRKSSGRTGIWSSPVADQYHPFVVPQEHGAHAQTRWCELIDRHGAGVHIAASEPISVSARFHHDADLSRAATLAELDISDTIELHLDAAVRGLGTGACGPDVSADCVVAPRRYTLTIRVTETAQ